MPFYINPFQIKEEDLRTMLSIETNKIDEIREEEANNILYLYHVYHDEKNARWEVRNSNDTKYPELICYKISDKKLMKWMEEGIIAPVVPGNWGVVSLTVGICSGFFWMATESVIKAQAPMVLAIASVTSLVYPSAEILLFRKNNARWPSNQEIYAIAENTRDLAVKLTLSTIGWMTGSYYAETLEFENALATTLIAACDAASVAAVNLLNGFAKGKDVSALLWDTLNLMGTVAGAAAIWQQISVSEFTNCNVLKSLVNCGAIAAEFYIVPKIAPKLASFFKSITDCCSSSQNDLLNETQTLDP